MKLRYCVDRVVEGILVLVPDEDGAPVLKLDKNDYPYAQNDVLDIELDECGDVVSATARPDVRDERLAKNKSRLHALFNKNKK